MFRRVKSQLVAGEYLLAEEYLATRNKLCKERKGGDDMGKVIGKHGRIAKALRTVVKAAASKTNEKIVVQIVQ